MVSGQKKICRPSDVAAEFHRSDHLHPSCSTAAPGNYASPSADGGTLHVTLDSGASFDLPAGRHARHISRAAPRPDVADRRGKLEAMGGEVLDDALQRLAIDTHGHRLSEMIWRPGVCTECPSPEWPAAPAHRETERLGGVEIDRKLERGRWHDRRPAGFMLQAATLRPLPPAATTRIGCPKAADGTSWPAPQI